MTIRNKTILVLSISTLAMMVMLIWAVSTLFTKKMDQLETDKATLDMERIDSAIESEKTNLDEKIADWASWDDSYQFMQDKNEAYIKSNLETSASFESLRLSFIIFIDTKGEVFYQVGYNQNTKEMETVNPGINQYMARLSGNHAGMLRIDERILLVASKSILTSNSEGPTTGTIVFGRYFDEGEMGRLAKITKHAHIELVPQGETKLLHNSLLEIDQQNLEGRGLVNDLFGNPMAYYKVVFAREIHAQGAQGVKYISLILVLVSTIFFGMVWLLLGKLVLNPIKQITLSVNKVANTKDFATKIEIKSNDELGTLGRDINLMLDSLSISKDQVFAEAEKSRSFFDVVPGIIVIIDKNGVVTSINKKGAMALGRTIDEVVGKNWFETFIPEEEREKTKGIFAGLTEGRVAEDDKYHENKVITKSGEQILIGWHNSLLRDMDDKVVATVSHGEDVTAQKIQKEAERKQKEQLERVNKLMVGRELKMVELKKALAMAQNKKILKKPTVAKAMAGEGEI